MNSRKIATIAVMPALAVATNYAMVSLPNVKLMDAIVFIGGVCFGPVAGASIGVLTWAVYGTLNPFGFSFYVWCATMLSEAIYGVAGGLIRKSFERYNRNVKHPPTSVFVFFGVLGVLLTMAYDVITNAVLGQVYNLDVLFAVVSGFVPFGIVHELSNALFFGLGCVPTIRAISRIVGVGKFGIPEK